MVIKFKKLSDNAKTPVKAHSSDAGFDLSASSFSIDDKGLFVYGTGIAVDIPVGYVGKLYSRSSIAKYGLSLTNCVGIIDAGYHGEIMMKFRPTETVRQGRESVYQLGERIGQLIIEKLPDVEMVEADELGESERGTGGYGSTGK